MITNKKLSKKNTRQPPWVSPYSTNTCILILHKNLVDQIFDYFQRISRPWAINTIAMPSYICFYNKNTLVVLSRRLSTCLICTFMK